MKELVFEITKCFGQVVFEASTYDGREFSYSSDEEDVFEAMKELQEEYNEYEVLFRMKA